MSWLKEELEGLKTEVFGIKLFILTMRFWLVFSETPSELQQFAKVEKPLE